MIDGSIEAMEVGHWTLDAQIEIQPQLRFSATDPAPGKGDLFFRVVLSLAYNDDSGESGVAGELSTPWLWSAEEAVKQARLLRVLGLNWYEYDDDKDDYVLHEGSAGFDDVIDLAYARFRATMPGVD